MTATNSEMTRRFMSAEVRALIGSITYLLGVLISIAAGVATFWLFEQEIGSGSIWPLLGMVTAVVLAGVLGLALILLSTSFFVPMFDQVAMRDKRRPVLFLRPFEEDVTRTYDVIPVGEGGMIIHTATADEFLMALNAAGPLVSIGQPDWKSRLGMLPEGAYRLIAEAEQWQDTVVELMRQARLVVLTVGDSPGIEWEVEAVKENVHREALLLYLPPRPFSSFTKKGRENKEKKFYEEFKTMIENRLKVHLPEFQEAVYIIGFDKDGEAIIGKNPPTRWWWTDKDRVSNEIRTQLKEVIAVVAPKTDLSRYGIIGQGMTRVRYAVAILLFLMGLGIGWFSFVPKYGAFFREAITPLASISSVNLALLGGWILIAKHFRKRWIWIIPTCQAVSWMAQLWGELAQRAVVPPGYVQGFYIDYNAIASVTSALSASLVLFLGLWLYTQRGYKNRN